VVEPVAEPLKVKQFFPLQLNRIKFV
jgi:hypothetical protein